MECLSPRRDMYSACSVNRREPKESYCIVGLLEGVVKLRANIRGAKATGYSYQQYSFSLFSVESSSSFAGQKAPWRRGCIQILRGGRCLTTANIQGPLLKDRAPTWVMSLAASVMGCSGMLPRPRRALSATRARGCETAHRPRDVLLYWEGSTSSSCGAPASSPRPLLPAPRAPKPSSGWMHVMVATARRCERHRQLSPEATPNWNVPARGVCGEAPYFYMYSVASQ
eukprot:scaffold1315_cov405-Prasinococcus_capsulatus_cf.AAC.8